MVGTSGKIAAIGDTDYEFAIMSVSKPFVFALVCQEVGRTKAREKLGVNSTGLPFNPLSAIERQCRRTDEPDGERRGHRHHQPRAGRRRGAERWRFVETACPGSPAATLAVDEEVYASASATNFRNQGIAHLLGRARTGIYCDPAEATDLYTRQCSCNDKRQRPRGDGRDAGRRRGQSAHQAAGGRPRPVPLRRWR